MNFLRPLARSAPFLGFLWIIALALCPSLRAGDAPVFTSQPGHQSVKLGSPVRFSVTASGTGPLSYQWKKNNLPIAGATDAVLVIASAQPDDAGGYLITVTNSAGSAVASTWLTVEHAPIFTTQPSDIIVENGLGFEFRLSITTAGSSGITWTALLNDRAVEVQAFLVTQQNDSIKVILRFKPVKYADSGVLQLFATNPYGTTASAATRLIVAATAPPLISDGPVSQGIVRGSQANFSVTVTGTAPLSYQWTKDGKNLVGQTTATLTLPEVQSLDAGAYTVTVTNSAGSITSSPATLTIFPPPPVIITAPRSRTIVLGTPVPTFTVVARGEGSITYRWYRDYGRFFDVLSSVTGPDFTPTSAGNYAVAAVNEGGSSPYSRFSLAVKPLIPARLINLSLLAALAPGEDATLGFVIGGDDTVGTKPLLIRGVGPTLAQFGVANACSDPRLELFSGATKLSENDDWNTDAGSQAALFASVGAFPLTTNSKDASLYTPALAAGANSVRISGSGTTSGTVLAELYDTNPGQAVIFPTPRLVNVSVLKKLGSGLTAGFVIGGTGPLTVLIRAVGPSLAPFGVADPVSDPALSLKNSEGDTLATNDNWQSADSPTMSKFGAFTLPVGSKDAALVTPLLPGNYTVQVTASGANATGAVLVEVYEVP
jgi:hypothetical protein